MKLSHEQHDKLYFRVHDIRPDIFLNLSFAIFAQYLFFVSSKSKFQRRSTENPRKLRDDAIDGIRGSGRGGRGRRSRIAIRRGNRCEGAICSRKYWKRRQLIAKR